MGTLADKACWVPVNQWWKWLTSAPSPNEPRLLPHHLICSHFQSGGLIFTWGRKAVYNCFKGNTLSQSFKHFSILITIFIFQSHVFNSCLFLPLCQNVGNLGAWYGDNVYLLWFICLTISLSPPSFPSSILLSIFWTVSCGFGRQIMRWLLCHCWLQHTTCRVCRHPMTPHLFMAAHILPSGPCTLCPDILALPSYLPCPISLWRRIHCCHNGSLRWSSLCP